jgi:UDP-glucose 4-epimerase
MLKHLNTEEKKPKRVVILGSSGFIGSAIHNLLERNQIPVLGIASKDLDLMSPDAGKKLTEIMKTEDVLVFISAIAPCKDSGMLLKNIQIAKSVCNALEEKPVAQVVYISSDAVYGDSDKPISEFSCAEPGSVHGVMHLAREIILKQVYPGPLTIVRPTLVYGLNDPHNSYGPNRFRRLARAGMEIVLFGDGEERRDHVDVEDIAELVVKIILRKSTGLINAVSGEVVSFRELADLMSRFFEPSVAVKASPRSGPMPHNGYRAFDNAALTKAFPGLNFKSWRQGLAQVNEQFKAQVSK